LIGDGGEFAHSDEDVMQQSRNLRNFKHHYVGDFSDWSSLSFVLWLGEKEFSRFLISNGEFFGVCGLF
jgi:hypothetical protein